jgi:hypothetical protein
MVNNKGIRIQDEVSECVDLTEVLVLVHPEQSHVAQNQKST